MQQWQFFPALMKLARSGLSDIIENDFEVNVVVDVLRLALVLILTIECLFCFDETRKVQSFRKHTICNSQGLTSRAYLQSQRI